MESFLAGVLRAEQAWQAVEELPLAALLRNARNLASWTCASAFERFLRLATGRFERPARNGFLDRSPAARQPLSVPGGQEKVKMEGSEKLTPQGRAPEEPPAAMWSC